MKRILFFAVILLLAINVFQFVGYAEDLQPYYELVGLTKNYTAYDNALSATLASDSTGKSTGSIKFTDGKLTTNFTDKHGFANEVSFNWSKMPPKLMPGGNFNLTGSSTFNESTNSAGFIIDIKHEATFQLYTFY